MHNWLNCDSKIGFGGHKLLTVFSLKTGNLCMIGILVHIFSLPEHLIT